MAVHLFLSPHLDDAVLSCGGIIHDLVRHGERVVIVTVMAGNPPDDLPDTPSLRAVKSRWNLGHYLVSTRRLEDARAALALGALFVQMPFLECLFRTARSGDGARAALYPRDDSPFVEYDGADDLRVLLLECQSPVRDGVATIYAPLCVDHHVDHRLVRDWALVLTGAKNAPSLKFYEEYPSIQNKMALQRAMEFYRTSMPMLTLQPEAVTLSDESVAAKIHAIGNYRSDVELLWQTAEKMEHAVREYMLHCGGGRPAERLWSVMMNAPAGDYAQTIDIIP